MADETDAELLRRQLAQLAAAERTSGAGPLQAISGGFFGCFGVLAAVIVGLFVLMVIVEARSDGSGSGINGPSSAATASASDYVTTCAAATVSLERNYPRLGKIEPSAGDPAILSRDPVVLMCVARSWRGLVAYSVRVNCRDLLRPGCREIVAVKLGGRYL